MTAMRAGIFHTPGNVSVETVPDPTIIEPTDAIVRVTRATVCGSDLWSYRGVTKWEDGWRTGHEFIGVVEVVGSGVADLHAGDEVVSPFSYCDNTCEFCRAGVQTSCVHAGYWGGNHDDGGQGQFVRVPMASGTLVRVPEALRGDRSKLAALALLTDVVPTGHHAAVRAGVRPGVTAAVIGDGAVGLCAVLGARRLGAERVIAVGHHGGRLEIARQFGADHVVDSRDDDEAAERVRELTAGGAQCVLEAVGTQPSMDLAIDIARPGGTIGFVGVPHTVGAIDLRQLLGNNVSLAGGVAPARAYIPMLLDELAAGGRDATAVLDMTVPLDRLSEGFAAMNGRTAIKVLLEVSD
jgi:threonine dehydrogenase-like Zn-dependent dehydrogenase